MFDLVRWLVPFRKLEHFCEADSWTGVRPCLDFIDRLYYIRFKALILVLTFFLLVFYRGLVFAFLILLPGGLGLRKMYHRDFLDHDLFLRPLVVDRRKGYRWAN
jgi:hypothetical protein